MTEELGKDPNRQQLKFDAEWLLKNLRTYRSDKSLSSLFKWDSVLLGILTRGHGCRYILQGLGVKCAKEDSQLETSADLDINFYGDSDVLADRSGNYFSAIRSRVTSSLRKLHPDIEITFLLVNRRIDGRGGVAGAIDAGFHAALMKTRDDLKYEHKILEDQSPPVDYLHDRERVLKRDYTFQPYSVRGILVNKVYSLPTFLKWNALQNWQPKHTENIRWDADNPDEEYFLKYHIADRPRVVSFRS